MDGYGYRDRKWSILC